MSKNYFTGILLVFGLICFVIAGIRHKFNDDKCGLRTQSIHGIANLGLNVGENNATNYDLIIIFDSFKSWKNFDIQGYSYFLGNQKSSKYMYQEITKLSKHNAYIINDVEKGLTHYLVIGVKYVHKENKKIYSKDSIWQLFKVENSSKEIELVNSDCAPKIYNACVICLRNGKLNIAVSWNFPGKTYNLEYMLVELDPSPSHKSYLRRYLVDSKALSYTLINVRRNREYRISISVFKNRNFDFNQAYVCHTVFVSTNSSSKI